MLIFWPADGTVAQLTEPQLAAPPTLAGYLYLSAITACSLGLQPGNMQQ